jgi:ERCC4-type nuclease
LVDTREKYPWRFSKQKATTSRRALPAGDYAVEFEGDTVGVVERKSLPDLAHDLIDGSLAFAMAELAAMPHAAIAVEDGYSRVFRLERTTPGFVADLLAQVQVRYPNVPIVFCETRPLAEEWTFRFLGAALAEARLAGPAAPSSTTSADT